MLTLTQRKAFDFIEGFITENGYSPTTTEIATGIGIKSKGVAHRYVQALKQAGLITVTPKRHRNIELAPASNEEDKWCLPIIGKIAAGLPIEAVADQRMFNVAESILGPNRYILQVKGDSMIGDNICEEDFIICEQRQVASDGEIVVALVDKEEATLKRIMHNTDGTVTLLPSNPRLSPMIFDATRVQIQGVYLGLVRMELRRH